MADLINSFFPTPVNPHTDLSVMEPSVNSETPYAPNIETSTKLTGADGRKEERKTMAIAIPYPVHDALKRAANNGDTTIRGIVLDRLETFAAQMANKDPETLSDTVNNLTQCFSPTAPMKETTVQIPVSLIRALHDLAILGHVKYQMMILAALVSANAENTP